MKSELITIFLGFLEGFTLILSPCILSILPIILAGSLIGSKKRAVGIIIGFILSFALFALFAKQIVHYSGVDLNLVRYMAYGLLLMLALVLLSNHLTQLFNRLTEKMSSLGSRFTLGGSEKNGFWRGLFLGALVAIIWTPCAGPILAAIIVQIIIQKTTLLSFLTLLAFALGAALPMFIITLYGFKIRDAFQFFKTHSVLIRKTLGAIIILNVAYMLSLESGIFPSTVINQSTVRSAHYLENGLWRPYQAPPIAGIQTWINSPPLQLSALKGKVVLVDFWTYSCINCVRTLPYLKNWYQQYHNKGLVIIGVHTPEFDFEANKTNVAAAVESNNIKYPVALDNSFTTWQNYANQYWPAHYLINREGMVVYEHFGEGDDDVTENNIRFLLGMDQSKTSSTPNEALFSEVTPETYLGYARADTNLGPKLFKDSSAEYHFPNLLKVNAWGLEGAWQVQANKITSAATNSSLKIHFKARKVFIVMGNHSKKPIRVTLFLNDKSVTQNKGADVSNSTILVDKYSIYEALVFPHSQNGILKIHPDSPGLEIYTFTFGG